MRHLVRMALLALAVVAGVALPAAAESRGQATLVRERSHATIFGARKLPLRGLPVRSATTTRRRHRAGRPTTAIELIVPASMRHRSGKSTRGKRIAGRHGKGHKAVAQQRKDTAKPAVAATATPESQPAQKQAETTGSQKKPETAERKATAPEAAPKAPAPKAQASASVAAASMASPPSTGSPSAWLPAGGSTRTR